MKYFLILLFISTTNVVFAQGQYKLFGTIRDDDGEALSHATVFIKELGTGAVSNDQGKYEILLKPGVYHLVFQYLGYNSLEKSVEVRNKDEQVDVILEPQTVLLKDIVVTGVDEDPAYAVMRKAIAKAKYHTQQIDSFSAKVYLKGKGRLIDAPFYLRRTLKKEGIDSGKLFVSESFNEIKYKRPSTYSERVISVRSSGPEEMTSPMNFVSGSFYESQIGNVISPLSPKAFAYYRFEYMGTFKDKGYEISKIRVRPRVEGENVVKGVLYLVEDYFSIHSLDFTTHQMGVKINIKQLYEPIRENVWLPVSHQFYISGEIWGFDFEYDYLASVSDYDITLNPELPQEIEVIDEKTEKNLMEEYEKITPESETGRIQEKLVDGEEVATKDLEKVLKAYEKQERKEKDDPYVVYKKDFSVDSTAYQKDSVYWAELRPIPLNEREKKGYNWLDSLAQVEQKKAEGDSISSDDKDKFGPFDIIMGARYDVGDKAYLRLKKLSAEFNTVEGINLETAPEFTKTFEDMQWLKVNPVFRYGFSSKNFYYRLNTEYAWGPKLKRNSLKINGGNYIFQYNADNPIHPTINSITTLFLQDNLMKLYEKEFVDLQFTKSLKENLSVTAGAEWSYRKSLTNNSDYTLIDVANKKYSDNIPYSIERASTSFSPHHATIFNAEMRYRPGLRFVQLNDNYFEAGRSVPELRLNYRQGTDMLEGESNFKHLQLSVNKRFNLKRNTLNTGISAGTFFGNSPDYFTDFKHFMGNETPFLPSKSFETFRLLDYYAFSTGAEYLTGHLQYNPAKLLFTQFRKMRLEGIKEYLFANYLGTKFSDSYYELGIGFDNIFRIFRVEAVTSFQNGQYQDFGVRVGVASFLNFSDNGLQVSF